MVIGHWSLVMGGGGWLLEGVMPVQRFEELRVYQMAEELADAVWSMVAEWETFAKETLGKQIVRSADSVGANISEGFGRGTYNDNKRFVRMARGSLYETRHWLRRAFKRSLINDDQVTHIKPLIQDLAPMLNAYLNAIGPTDNQSPNTND